MSTADKPDTRRGGNWTPPADGVQCFEGALDEGSPDEICLHCGKHISQHYGGTEYRCDPRSDSQIVAIYDENDEHPPVEVRRDSGATDDEAGFIRHAVYSVMRRPRSEDEGLMRKPSAQEAEYVADTVARLWREHRATRLPAPDDDCFRKRPCAFCSGWWRHEGGTRPAIEHSDPACSAFTEAESGRAFEKMATGCAVGPTKEKP